MNINGNPIYDFLKANKLTDKDESTFLQEYSNPDKAKEIHQFFVDNKLTDKNFDDFYGEYLKKKDGSDLTTPSSTVSTPVSSDQQQLPSVNDPSYQKYVDGILNQNSKLNFVQRIRNPKESIDIGNGQHATHLMAYDPDSKTAYPTVVMKDGKLTRLDPGDEAYNYAMKTGEYIKFPTAEDAEKFANNGYKIVWNNNDNPFLQHQQDQIDLARKADELSKKVIPHVGGGTGGAAIGYNPDVESIKQGQAIKDQLKGQGYDPDKLVNDFSDFPEEAYGIKNSDGTTPYSRENLLKLYKDNPIEYDNTLNNLKTTFSIAKAATQKAKQENPGIDDNTAKKIGAYQANLFNSFHGQSANFDEYSTKIRRQQEIINQTLDGEEKDKALDRLKQTGSTFVTPNSVVKDYGASPLKDKLNLTQFAGLKTLQLFDPEKYQQYTNMLNKPIDVVYEHNIKGMTVKSFDKPSTSDDHLSDQTVSEQIGQENILRDMAEIGRQNAIVTANKNILTLKSKIDAETDPQKKQQLIDSYNKNVETIDAINEDKKKDAQRYPLTTQMQLDEKVKDEAGQAPGYVNYFFSHLGHQLENVTKSVQDIIGDDASLQRQRLGEDAQYQHENYLPESIRKDGKNLLSKATAYHMAGFMGDVAGIIGATMATPGGESKVSSIIKNTAPMFLTAQSDYYNEAVKNGDPNPNAYANVHSAVVALAGMISPKIDYVKKVVGASNPVLAKTLEAVGEKEWNGIVEKNRPLVDKFASSVQGAFKESTKQALTFGAGLSVANDLVDKYNFDKKISGQDIVDHALDATKDMFVGNLPLMGIHTLTGINHVPDTHKALLWEIGDHKDIALRKIDDAKNAGDISPEQAEKRKAVVKQVSTLISKVPTRDAKGVELTDKQRMDYLYNTYIKAKSNELKSDVPSTQKDKVEKAGTVADFRNSLIVEPKTDEQLTARKKELESLLSNDGKDEQNKLSDVDRKNAEAELEAVNDELDKAEKGQVVGEHEGIKIRSITDGQKFHDAIKAAAEARKNDGVQVTVKSPEEYNDIIKSGGKLLLSEDGKFGAMVMPDGYMGSLFKHPESSAKEVGKTLQELRVKSGGRFFDAFGTHLEDIYIKNGFEPIARVPFNEEYAPEGWRNTVLKDKPDVVFFRYNPHGEYQKGDGKRFEDWDEAYNFTQQEVANHEHEFDFGGKRILQANGQENEQHTPEADSGTGDQASGTEGDVAPKEAAKVVSASNLHELDSEIESREGDQKKVLQDIKTVVPAINDIVKNETGNDVQVHIHDNTESYRHAIEKAGGSGQEAAGSKGVWISKDGAIHLNMQNVTSGTMLHEGFHPVLDFVAKHSPDTIDSLFIDLQGTNTGKDIINEVNDLYSDSSETQRKKEAITHFIEGVANGDIKVDETNFEKVKNFFKSLLNKLGFNFAVKENEFNNVPQLQEFAKTISDKLKSGEKIKEGDLGESYVGKPEKLSDDNLEKAGDMEDGTKPLFDEPIEFDEDAFDVEDDASAQHSKAKKVDLKGSKFDGKEVDVKELFKEFKKKFGRRPKVWVWMADQLKRGQYKNDKTGVTHDLEGGLGFAIDPKMQKKGIVWASSMPVKTLEKRIGASDFTFLMTGSPKSSYFFSKGTTKVLLKEIAAGLKKNVGKKVEINGKTTKIKSADFSEFVRIANLFLKDENAKKWKEFKSIINDHGHDVVDNSKRIKFVNTLLHSGGMNPKGTAPIEINHPFQVFVHKMLGVPTLAEFSNMVREDFLINNDFKNGHIGLIIKPEGVIPDANVHDTYPHAITGQVIGVPSGKFHVTDVLPKDAITPISKKTGKPLDKASESAKIKTGVGDMGKVYDAGELQFSKSNGKTYGKRIIEEAQKMLAKMSDKDAVEELRNRYGIAEPIAKNIIENAKREKQFRPIDPNVKAKAPGGNDPYNGNQIGNGETNAVGEFTGNLGQQQQQAPAGGRDYSAQYRDPVYSKGWWQRVKDGMKSFGAKYFSRSKGMPDWFLTLSEKARGEQQFRMRIADQTIKEVKSIAKKIGFGTGENAEKDWNTFDEVLRDLKQPQLEKFQPLSDETGVQQFDPYRASDAAPHTIPNELLPALYNVGSLEKLPEELRPLALKMRAQIDGLGRDLVVNGLVSPEQALTIEANMGTYMHRTYEAFNKKNWAKEIDPTIKKEAHRFLAEEAYAKINATAPEGMTEAEKIAQAGEMASKRLQEIVDGVDDNYSPGKYNVNKGKDLGTLKVREDIPEPIRKLLGEYHDPALNFMITISKLATLKSQSQMLQRVRDMGMGTLFFEQHDPNRPQQYSVPAAADGSDTWSPLNGLMTTPETKELLHKSEAEKNALMKLWLNTIGIVRWGKTVGSPITQIRNLLSNTFFAVANGHFRVTEFGKGAAYAWDSLFQGGKMNDADINEVIQENLIGQNVTVAELKSMLQSNKIEDMIANSSLTKKSAMQKVGDVIKAPFKKMNDVYAVSDELWKIYGYLNERSDLSNALFKKKYEELTPEQQMQIRTEASERIKNTYPTYSRMWEGLGFLSRNFPIFGNFLAFQAESIRVALNTVHYAVKDMKSEETRAIGMKRMAGTMTYLAARTAAIKVIAHMLGIGMSGIMSFSNNDDEDQKLKDFNRYVAPYLKTGDKLVKQTAPGVYDVYDASTLDPYGLWWRTTNAFTSGSEKDTQGVLGMVQTLLDPFIEPEMTYETYNQIRDNQDANGKPIMSVHHPKGEQFMEAVGYALKKLRPSAIDLVQRIQKNGVANEALSGVGARPNKTDFNVGFTIKLKNAEEKFNSIYYEYISKLKKASTEEEKHKITEEANKYSENVIEELHEDYLAALRCGVPESSLKEALDKKKFYQGYSKDVKLGVKSGSLKKDVYNGKIKGHSSGSTVGLPVQ